MSAADGFDVAGAVVVVTGGGSGIGRQICLESAARGAKAVVAVDFNLDAAKETEAMLQGKCEQTMALYADCGKEVDVSERYVSDNIDSVKI